MDIQAAVLAEIHPYTAEPTVLDKAILDEGLDTAATYTVDDKVNVAKVAIVLFKKFIVLASEGEGGLSMSYDIEALKARIRDLAQENGLSETITANATPSVRNASFMW